MKRAAPLLFALLSWPSADAQLIHEVHRVEISPGGEDYAPVFMDSGFVMCSVRENAALVGFVDAESGKPLSDLYWVPYREGRAGSPVLFSQNLATPVNEGPASFADGGTTICYTRNQVLPKKLSNMRSANGQLGLFFSEQLTGAWSAPTPFEHNDPKSSNLHPAFSPDGRTLIFASDRPGGFGGMDLYRSERTDAGWTAPTNLGPAVNGPGNEVYPRMQSDGTLHFSSSRPGGMGGLDIYFTHEADGAWAPVQSMLAPVNSPADDHGYSQFADGYRALMSSKRDGTDAIYLVKLTVPRFRDCTEQKPNNYCYSMRRRPHAATTSIPVEHVWDMGDGTRIKGNHAQHCYTKPGVYTVRSLLIDRKTGDIFHLLGSNTLEVADVSQAWVAAQDTVRTGRRLELHGALSHVPGMKAAEYHWDMGDGTLLEGLRQVHAFKQPGVYTVKLDVLSLPDSNGVIANRCNSKTIIVLDRFKDHEDLAMVAEYQDAFGKTHTFEYQELPFDETVIDVEAVADVVFSVQLFASKQRVDLDDPKFAQIKKLYRVVERFDPITSLYTYSVGETKNAEELYQVFKKVKELQFLDAEVFALRVEQLMDLSQLDLASLEELNHKKLRTSAIHFAYKSAAIDTASEPVLEQVATLMRQHPELNLVIEAHTDDIGSRRYNMDLSQARALAVMDHLIEHDVLPARMVPVGHGKNQPIASNKSEQGRALNRRVEFRLVVKEPVPATSEMLSGASPKRSPKR